MLKGMTSPHPFERAYPSSALPSNDGQRGASGVFG